MPRGRTMAITCVIATLAVVAAAALLVVRAGGSQHRRSVPTAAREPRAALRCNGDESFCDLPIDRVVFPGTHNSMASVAYPGWLYGEQALSIRAQLDAGIRALLVDTYYGVVDEARSRSAGRPVVATTTAPPAGIYLCHAHCELGAVPIGDALADVKGFLDANPSEVVALIVQDSTLPADTADAIAAAGLAGRAATLHRDERLPTLRQLVESGENLLVFAEKGGRGAPSWYHRAFDWFQETPFTFTDAAQMSCAANRGRGDAPLFLVNHWLTASPPDSSIAAAVNAPGPLTERFRRCQAERGRLPNVVAVDFADKGDVVATLRALNRQS